MQIDPHIIKPSQDGGSHSGGGAAGAKPMAALCNLLQGSCGSSGARGSWRLFPVASARVFTDLRGDPSGRCVQPGGEALGRHSRTPGHPTACWPHGGVWGWGGSGMQGGPMAWGRGEES